ncbi:hypothetical protein WDU94_003369, partial [Cyamophila willieti]
KNKNLSHSWGSNPRHITHILRILEFSRVILLILRLVDEETFFAISYRFGYKLVIPLPHTHTATQPHSYIVTFACIYRD